MLVDPTLYTLAKLLDDLEGVQIAQGHRVRILTKADPDEDGVQRGFGLTEDHPGVVLLRQQSEMLTSLVDTTVKSLQKQMRKNPLNTWRKTASGVGEKTLARLLGVIGDPYWREDVGQPRTVSQLWAYCGLHTLGGHAPRRQHGVQSNWSVEAKSRTYLIAQSAMKAGVRTLDPDVDESEIEGYPVDNRIGITEYGSVYLDRRRATQDRIHSADCVRCGPKGFPAKAGSPWSGSHQNADALRVLSKRILRDLWRAARDCHLSS